MGRKTVVVLSGGMDSSTLLYFLLKAGHQVKAIGFDYGQRHRKELNSARLICEKLDVPFVAADLTTVAPLFAGQSALLGKVDVPHGHYADESMKATVVPNRNMIMLSLAAGHAIASGFNAIAYGAHAGDHDIYPDCRVPFIEALGSALLLCDWQPVELLRPFADKRKEDIARLGEDLCVPWSLTWSCYEGGQVHCGKCGTCVERREAFALAGIEDPTEYAQE